MSLYRETVYTIIIWKSSFGGRVIFPATVKRIFADVLSDKWIVESSECKMTIIRELDLRTLAQ
jgi:hypothetical protein